MPKFSVGAKVRIKAGSTDPENPDVPIGLWCGTIEEADDSDSPVSYVVRWDERTLKHMPPFFLRRCKAEDLEIETMWLDEEQLESDDGQLLLIERGPALSFDDPDPDKRLLALFGLGPADEIPGVDEVSLRLYHAYLLSHMRFPFAAEWQLDPEPAPPAKVQVLRLLPVESREIASGLLCEVQSPDRKGLLPLFLLKTDPCTPQGRLLADYTAWYEDGQDEGPDLFTIPGAAGIPGQGPRLPLWKLLRFSGLTGAVFGATIGAIAAVKENPRTGMLIGAGVFALLLSLLGRQWGRMYAALSRSERGPGLGTALGLVLGGLLGVLLGTLALTFIGAITGCIVASLLVDGIVRKGPRGRIKFVAAILAACLGGVIEAITIHREAAVQGALVGASVGLLVGAFIVLAALATLVLLISRRRP